MGTPRSVSPEALARVAAYVRASGLEQLSERAGDVTLAVADLLDAMGEVGAVSDADGLYRYPVPMLSEDGSCSVVDELSPSPYDLAGILGGRSEQATRRLALLKRLVERTQQTTGADWVGVYARRSSKSGGEVLVKVAYVGRPSRAEFPLTAQFAAGSTNSSVGLTGRALVIDDVAKHVEAGGGFYVCDAEVQSEACLPLLNERGQVAGILDAEAKPRGFFSATRLAALAALAIVAAPILP